MWIKYQSCVSSFDIPNLKHANANSDKKVFKI